MEYRNRKIAVLGCGESGQAAAELLGGEGADVTVFDSAERKSLDRRVRYLDRLGIPVRTGAEADTDSTPFDRAILSPGIDPAALLVQNFLRRRIGMIGELELAYELCRCPVIGITGTNGKTTTTGLIASMMEHAGRRIVAGGNMGPPFSSLVRQSAGCEAAVVEISSFQLERIERFRARVAVWLNFAPDHLDRYRSIDDYRAAKLRIFENQTADDVAVVNAAEAPGVTRARTITFSALGAAADFTFAGGSILHRGERVLALDETRLRGVHNAENLMAALAAGMAWGMTIDEMKPGLCAYRALAHRNELVGEAGGVRYINDSKSTNPSSLEMGLRSLEGPAVLIAGGKEKGFSFDGVAPLLAGRVREAVLIGQVAGAMAAAWSPVVPCRIVGSLADAVTTASTLAHPGDTVLLSPGTSSFDMFRNYADRGEQFCNIVKSHILTTNPEKS